ncbi:MAG: hypothetical protein WBD40_17315 [Tepidisphaeraceae bacterium]
MPSRKKNVRKGKPSAREQAYEPPAEVDFSKGLVFRGVKAWRQYLSWKRGYVKLDPELREVFPDDRAVNALLRQVVEVANKTIRKNRKKSA